MKKCPNCGFEPLNEEGNCPNCEELLVNQSEEAVIIKEKNDDIHWSDLKSVPLGKVMEQLQEELSDTAMSDETKLSEEQEPDITVEASTTQAEQVTATTQSTTFEDNPILAAYLRAHKEGRQIEAQAEIEELIRQQAQQPIPEAIESKEEEQTEMEPVVATVELVDEEEQIETEQEVEEAPQTTEELELASNSEDTIELPVEVAPEIKKAVESITEELSIAAVASEKASEITSSSVPPIKKEEPGEELPHATDTTPLEEVATVSLAQEASVVEELESPAADSLTTVDATKQAIESVEVESKPSTAQHLEDAQPPVFETQVKQAVKQRKHKRKLIYAASAIAVIGLGSGIYYTHEQASAQAEKKKQEDSAKEVQQMNQQLRSFYTDSTQQFVKSAVAIATIDKLVKDLPNYADTADYQLVKKIATDIQTKQKQTLALNQQFTKDILVDGVVQSDAHVKNINTATFTPRNDSSVFAKIYNQAVAQGEKEVATAKTAQTTTDTLRLSLNNGTLPATVTQANYEEANQQINQVADSTLKTALLQEMEPVKVALAKRTAEEQAKAAQAKAEQERVAQQKATADNRNQLVAKIQANTTYNEATQLLSPATPTNKANRPIIDSRQSDLADATNAAWNWGNGMYDFVINRSIAKGYIVAGGFYLERVRIENGEGYYNLYALTNDSAILKNLGPAALPMYIATINAKTGYFKGNGSN